MHMSTEMTDAVLACSWANRQSGPWKYKTTHKIFHKVSCQSNPKYIFLYPHKIDHILER
jgi:hypothetical protein